MEQAESVNSEEIVYYDTLLDKNCVELLQVLLSGDLITKF